MVEAAEYSEFETLRDGRQVEIRALKPNDRAGLLAAVGRTSVQSVFRRFFAAKRSFSEEEIAFFTNVDFVNHVALAAIADEVGQSTIIGGGRYIIAQPGKAEMAFAVVDEYQGRGIGSALLHHLVAIARASGVQELTAEVMPGNIAMLKVFKKGGFRSQMVSESQVVHVALGLV